MPLKYACFISYAHCGGKHHGPLVQAIHDELMSQLAMHCAEKVYLDSARLLPGYDYNEALATAICQSACMVVAYAPIYAGHEYCRRELAAMKQLEKKRKKLLGPKARGHGFIIPLVLAGDIASLPDELKLIPQAHDISRFTLNSHRLTKNRKFSEALEPVCQGILAAFNLLKNSQAQMDSAMDCGNYSLPRVTSWAAIPPLPFPGREGAP